MRTADLAIDLGSSGARVATRGRGVVAEDASVVAMRVTARGREVAAIGHDAREMLGRAHTGVEVIRPVRGGAVADFETTEHLLHHLIRAGAGRSLLRPRVLLPVPSAATEVERRAVQDSARAAGAREAAVLPAPLAAALGAGLPIDEPAGRLIVDVGAGATQVAVISLGGIVVERSLRLGGDDLDEAVALWLRSRRGVTLDMGACQALRIAVCTSGQPERVRGRDIQTGRPREVQFSGSDLVEALSEPLARMRDAVLQTLAETPPELSADIHDTGIVLCGGCARFTVLGNVLRKHTDLAVARAADPELCVIRGAALLLENAALLQRVAAVG